MFKMSELTAIDILVNPDEATMDRARALNAKLRENYPKGYELDESHQPHITTLQRYVRTADLPKVYDVVQELIDSTVMSKIIFHVFAIKHQDGWAEPGVGYAGFIAKPSDEALEYQAKLIEAVAPFTESGGNGGTFVQNEDGSPINQTTLGWVENYVPANSGANFMPHISCGFALDAYLDELEAEPFEVFDIQPASVSVYHLGNNGNAREELKHFDISS